MPYTIVAYKTLGADDSEKTVWHAPNKRSVVWLMKTIMDNFDPKHVDVAG